MRTKYFFKAGDVNVNNTLGLSGGYFVIYEKWIAVSPSDTTGHDDLLQKIATEHHLNSVVVKHLGMRFYYKYSPLGIIISGCREADNLDFFKNPELYSSLIKRSDRFF